METQRKAPSGLKINPIVVETKTARIQLTVQPSIKDRCERASKYCNMSLNEFCQQALDMVARATLEEPKEESVGADD